MKNFDPDQAAFFDPSITYFFYDLETSGLSPRQDRIMQFAGQRTDLDFHPLGDPVNLLVRLPDDTLPSPGAIMVTKITPQSTLQDGLTEREFCEYVANEIFTPGTIEVGYNSLRFDDEFMRHTFWRNFHDPYEWQWKDGRSKWDLLDVVRLTRALRPEGIIWPVSESNGKKIATNRLELLTKCNHISHEHAHDALSDVEALISVTKLIHDRQPQLFQYLFKMRDKNEIKKLVNLSSPAPFVYASGRYPGEFNKTTVAYPIGSSKNGNLIVFDLRHNLDDLLDREKTFQPEVKTSRFGQPYTTSWSWIPYVKELAYNHCPAVAPLGVLDAASPSDSTDPLFPFKQGTTGWQKIGLEKSKITENLQILQSHPEFIARMVDFFAHRGDDFGTPIDAESALYDGFLGDPDKKKCYQIRQRGKSLGNFAPKFSDDRLTELFLHYKAHNFPEQLTEKEAAAWQEYREARLRHQEKSFVRELEKLQSQSLTDPSIDPHIIEELVLWYQSLGDNDYA